MVRVIVLILVIVLGYIIIQRLKGQDPKQRRDSIKKLVLYGLIGAIILLALTGKVHWIGAAIAAAIPFLQRLLGLGIRLFPFYQQWVQQKQQQQPPPPSAANTKMTYEEALQIFGFESVESKEQIIQRHRELMQKNHPDRGGSDYLAARINEARDILLASIDS